MNDDPNRLRSEGSDFERRLLDAAGSEAPPPELVLGMQQALGLATIGAGATAAAAKSSVGAWVMTSVVVVALGVGVAAWQLTRSDATPLSPRATLVEPSEIPLAAPPRAEVGEASALAKAAPVEVSRTHERPAASESPAATVQAKIPAAHAADSKRDLREEIALIDAARSAVARRAPEQALESLRRYFATFPRGAFGPEAQVLRIEALEQSGRHAQAVSLANAFLAKHPDSPLAERVARSVGLKSM